MKSEKTKTQSMNKEKYVLQEVTTPALVREWLDLPKRIYKGNRNWVCPLDQDVEEVFDPARARCEDTLCYVLLVQLVF